MRRWIAAVGVRGAVVLGLGLGGCEPATEGSDPADSGNLDGDDASSPEDSPVGVYNVVDVNDTTNLELLEGGAFRTVTFGCDFEGSTRGLWALDGDEIVLTAADDWENKWREGVCPSKCFSWSYIGPEGEGLTAAAEEVRLTPQEDGSYSAAFFAPSQDQMFSGQRIEAGGQCLTCGEGTQPCDDPFSHDPWG